MTLGRPYVVPVAFRRWKPPRLLLRLLLRAVLIPAGPAFAFDVLLGGLVSRGELIPAGSAFAFDMLLIRRRRIRRLHGWRVDRHDTTRRLVCLRRHGALEAPKDR